MAVRTISTRLALEGESEYRAAVRNINAELALYRAELQKVEAEYKGNANSLAALEARQTAQRGQLEALNSRHREQLAMLERAREAQQKYAAQADALRAKLAALGDATEDNAREGQKLREELSKAEANMQKAANSATFYQRQLTNTEKDQIELNTSLEDTRRYMEEARTSTDGCATSVDRYGKEVKDAGDKSEEFGDKSKEAISTLAAALAAAGVAGAIREIAQAIEACINASVEFESAVTGVYKTVEGTPEQLAAIREGIKQMAAQMPATTTQIASVAEAAGQLGIATDNVLDFTKVMLDLGNSTNLTADEAASALAKFSNITGTAAEDYERLGAVIVGLGNNFATTESDIVAMSTRLASAGTLAGLTEAEIMALATAMSSVGIEAEAGGTSMSQTLTAMEKAVAGGGDALERFSKVAHMSAGDFAAAWETSPIEAIQAFISGLGSLDEQGESATLVLDELGLTGIRQSNMLKALALASDTLTGAVGLANTAWAENTALTEEASKRYETTESRMAMARNAAENLKAAIGDALTPALGDLADAGTDAFSWAADFVAENPALVQALMGAASAAVVLVAGVTGLMVVEKIIPLIAAFNSALALNPAIAIAAAVVGVTTALVALSASIEDDALPSLKELTAEARGLGEALDGAAQSYETTSAATQAAANVAGRYIERLKQLESAGMTTDEQSREYHATLALLCETVPELAGYIDLETDTIRGGTAALEENTKAWEQNAKAQAYQEYMKEVYASQSAVMIEAEQNSIRLLSAQESLEDAQRRYGAAFDIIREASAAARLEAEKHAETTGVLVDESYFYSQACLDAQASLSGLEAEIKAAEEQIELYSDAYKESERAVREANGTIALAEQAFENLTGAVDDAGGALVDTTGEQDKTQASLEELTEAGEAHTAVTKKLTNATDDLTAALSQQEEQGSLRLDTALDLIDAGYASALAFDTETGAITLNTEAYLQVTQAKIADQIASLENQRASVENTLKFKDEALMALDLGASYISAAEARKALEQEGTSYDAQIAALEALKSRLNDYSFSTASAARTSASSSRTMQTQAKRDLEAYKALREELDYQLNMEQLTQEEYYSRLARLRDEYLTDDENVDEYRKINEEIFKYDKQLAEKENELWAEQTEALISQLEERLQEITDKQEAMTQKLAGYGNLFENQDGWFSLNSLQSQIDVLDRYGETLEGLRSRGVSDSLLGEITALSVDDAVAYGDTLLRMSDERWEEYNQLWEEKQKRAIEIASQFYKSELETLQKEYDTQLASALDGLKDTAFLSGQDTAQGLIDGLSDKEQELYQKAQSMAAAISQMLAAAYTEPGEDADGSHAGGLGFVPYDGYVAELHRGERVLTADEARAYVARSMPGSYSLPAERGSEQTMAAAIVNGFAGAVSQLPASQGGEIHLHVNLDGREVAQAVYDPLKDIEEQRGD